MDNPGLQTLSHLRSADFIRTGCHIIDIQNKNAESHWRNFVLPYPTSNTCNHRNRCAFGNTSRDNYICLMGDYLAHGHVPGISIDCRITYLSRKQAFQREIYALAACNTMDFDAFRFRHSSLAAVYRSDKPPYAIRYRHYPCRRTSPSLRIFDTSLWQYERNMEYASFFHRRNPGCHNPLLLRTVKPLSKPKIHRPSPAPTNCLSVVLTQDTPRRKIFG